MLESSETTALDSSRSYTQTVLKHFQISAIENGHKLTKIVLVTHIFGVHFPDAQIFSWRQKNPLIQDWLDYFFVLNDIEEDVTFIDIVSSVASDHSVVYLKLSGAKIKVMEI